MNTETVDSTVIESKSSTPCGYENILLGGKQRKGYFRIDALQNNEKEFESKFITSFEYNSSGGRCFLVTYHLECTLIWIVPSPTKSQKMIYYPTL